LFDGIFQRLLIRLEEEVTGGILAKWWEIHSNFTSKVFDKELVRDTSHYTSTITVSSVRTDCTSVRHVTEQIPGYRDRRRIVSKGNPKISDFRNSPSLTIL
jgi:hypothetical protein